MKSTEELLAHPPSMAEVAGALLDTSHDAADSAVVAAELAAEGRWTPTAVHPDLAPVPAGLAALEAETEE